MKWMYEQVTINIILHEVPDHICDYIPLKLFSFLPFIFSPLYPIWSLPHTLKAQSYQEWQYNIFNSK